MPSKDKELCPIRLYADVYEKVKTKCFEDGLSYQKLTEFLLTCYVRNNVEIKKLVEDYVDKLKNKEDRIINEEETEDIYRLLESNSPLKDQDTGGKRNE
jgi:hypothetical protein